MMKRVSEAEEAGLNLTWSEILKTHFRMAWLKYLNMIRKYSQFYAQKFDLSGHLAQTDGYAYQNPERKTI